jgi:hypothetical protein
MGNAPDDPRLCAERELERRIARNPIAQVVTAPDAGRKDRQHQNQIIHGNGPQLNRLPAQHTAP